MARTRTAPRWQVSSLSAVLYLAVMVPVAAAQTTPQAAPPAATQPPPPDTSGIPLSFDRIREGVQREPRLQIDFLDPNTPVFRIEVQEREVPLEERWKVRDTAVWKGVMPPFGSTWHHEFLSMVTPKQHVAASPFGAFGNPAFPVGVPVLAIGSGIKTAWQNRQRAQIRRQVQEELRALEANRQQAAEKAGAGKPDSEQTEKTEKTGTSEKTQKTEKPERPEKPEKSEKPEKTPPR